MDVEFLLMGADDIIIIGNTILFIVNNVCKICYYSTANSSNDDDAQ